MKFRVGCHRIAACRRSPCGERGLKYASKLCGFDNILSLPVRGAWIEISFSDCNPVNSECRSPCGERGLKYHII